MNFSRDQGFIDKGQMEDMMHQFRGAKEKMRMLDGGDERFHMPPPGEFERFDDFDRRGPTDFIPEGEHREFNQFDQRKEGEDFMRQGPPEGFEDYRNFDMPQGLIVVKWNT